MVGGGIYKVADFVNKYPEVKKLFAKIENHKGDWELYLRDDINWSYYTNHSFEKIYEVIEKLIKFTNGCDVNYRINYGGESFDIRAVYTKDAIHFNY